MIKKYFEYTIESKIEDLLKLVNRLNESKNEDEDELEGKFDEFLRFAFSKGKEVGLSIISYFYNLIKKNKKASLIIISLLILRFGVSELDIMKSIGLSDSDKEFVKGMSMDSDNSDTLSTDDKFLLSGGMGDVDDLLNAIAQRESSNDPGVVNRLGYIGLYQFGKGALTDLKIYKNKKKKLILDSKAFLKNPNLFPVEEQNKAMLRYLRLNRKYLKEQIKKFVGKKVGGVLITESGLLAGSHLLGHGGIKQFLNSNGAKIPVDGNNTPITEYIKKFGGYDLSDLEDKSLTSVENINPEWKKGESFETWVSDGKTKSPNL